MLLLTLRHSPTKILYIHFGLLDNASLPRRFAPLVITTPGRMISPAEIEAHFSFIIRLQPSLMPRMPGELSKQTIWNYGAVGFICRHFDFALASFHFDAFISFILRWAAFDSYGVQKRYALLSENDILLLIRFSGSSRLHFALYRPAIADADLLHLMLSSIISRYFISVTHFRRYLWCFHFAAHAIIADISHIAGESASFLPFYSPLLFTHSRYYERSCLHIFFAFTIWFTFHLFLSFDYYICRAH